MKNITLHIPRSYLKDQIIHTTHPECWEELTPAQFMALVRVMDGQIAEDDMLMEMLDLPLRTIKKLDAYQRYTLGELLDFIHNKTPFSRFVMGDIYGLKPPGEGLNDVSFGEFMHMDTFYADYMESGHEDDLLNLVACLYVHPAKNGERPEFNGRVNTHKVKQIHPLKCEAIAMNYGLLRSWLEEAFPYVFPSQKKEDNRQSPSGDNSWIGVFDSIVGDDIIHSDRYFNQPCMDMLRYMNKKVKERKQKK